MGPAKTKPDAASYSGRLAARLTELRTKAKLDSTAAAEAITKAGFTITMHTLYAWEAGRRRVDWDALPAIASAFRVSIRSVIPAE